MGGLGHGYIRCNGGERERCPGEGKLERGEAGEKGLELR